MPRSCPPPSICAVICTRGFCRRTYSAPHALGPYILCAVIDIRSILSLITFTGTLPMACTASVVEQHAAFFGDLADLGHGLDHADFVVGVHDADQDGFIRDRFAQHVEIDQAIRLHRQIGDAAAVLFEALARYRESPCARWRR